MNTSHHLGTASSAGGGYFKRGFGKAQLAGMAACGTAVHVEHKWSW